MNVVVGVDLAGVETRPTGFCRLAGMSAETCLLFTDEEILNKTRQISPAIVAIDAPLSLPPGRTTLEDRNGEHFRPCDRELMKRGIRFFPITLGPMRKLTIRGIGLKKMLKADGLTAVEAYPGGAQDILGVPRKQQGLEKLREGLANLGIRGLKRQMSDHELDAVTCAYVGKLYLEGKAAFYGVLNDGILMPK